MHSIYYSLFEKLRYVGSHYNDGPISSQFFLPVANYELTNVLKSLFTNLVTFLNQLEYN